MIRASFCCNDERGHPTGQVDEVHIEDGRGFNVELSGPSLRFIEERERVKVGRRFFAIVPGSAKYGYGNWCWDSARLSKREGLRLLRYLLERGFTATDWTVAGPFFALIQRAKRTTTQPQHP